MVKMKFGIAFDPKNKDVNERIPQIIDSLRKTGNEVVLEHSIKKTKKLKVSSLRSMSVDMIIAIGDSFNILRIFRELYEKQTPVLSVSLDKKNFLSEVNVSEFELAIEKISKGEFFSEQLSRLKIIIDGKEQLPVLNDVVIVSKSSSTICSYSLFVGDRLLFKDTGDGLIITTPTGSTAYSASAGGPIILSKTKAFSLTPLCSLDNNKPIVIDENDTVKIKAISSPSGCEAVLDGRFRVNIKSGEIQATNSAYPVYFVRVPGLTKDIMNKLKLRTNTSIEVSKTAPPSAKFIARMLQYEGNMTQKEIIKVTSLPPRTVRSALKYLTDHGVIETQTSLRDARYTIYYLKSV